MAQYIVLAGGDCDVIGECVNSTRGRVNTSNFRWIPYLKFRKVNGKYSVTRKHVPIEHVGNEKT